MKQTFEITVKRTRRVETVRENGARSYTWESLPDTRELVEVHIELEGLAQTYGQAACINKSGRSRLAGGLITFSNVSKLRRMK